jgi:hypothetical protein
MSGNLPERSAAAHEPRDGRQQLVGLFGLLVHFGGHHAVARVVVEQPSRDLVARPDGADLGEATTMTVPMVGWMIHRGRGRRAYTEMSAGMFLPTFAVIGLLWAGLLTDTGALMMIEHIAMLLSMLGAMLLRCAESDRHHGQPHTGQVDPTVDEQVGA